PILHVNDLGFLPGRGEDQSENEGDASHLVSRMRPAGEPSLQRWSRQSDWTIAAFQTSREFEAVVCARQRQPSSSAASRAPAPAPLRVPAELFLPASDKARGSGGRSLKACARAGLSIPVHPAWEPERIERRPARATRPSAITQGSRPQLSVSKSALAADRADRASH